MPKGIAIVKHRVSTDPQYCEFSTPDDGSWERSVCYYLRREFKTGKRGTKPVKLPRCSLFKEWLTKEFWTYRCAACKLACGEECEDGEVCFDIE